MSARRLDLASQWWTLRRFGLTPDKLSARFRNHDQPRIICISVPKSGTHLLERALCLHPKLYRRLVGTVFEGNEASRLKGKGLYPLLTRLRSGEILFAHLPYAERRREAIYASGARSIFMIRDPRDVAVSAARYLARNARTDIVQSPESLRADVAAVVEGRMTADFAALPTILERSAGWLDTETLVVRFEELVGPQGGGSLEAQERTLHDLYRHIGLRVEDSWLAELRGRLFSSSSPTFREGQIGGWRRHFDEPLKELFKAKVGSMLTRYGYGDEADW